MQVEGVMRNGITFVALAFGLATIAFAQTPGSNPDLSGTWVDSSNAADTIAINEKGDNIKVRELDGDRVVADYTCNLSGQPCKIKEEGREVEVSLYYNGSKLVEFKQRGNDVEKRRFTLGNDGKTMLVETIPISSTGKSIQRTYQKQTSQVAKSG
jgi:hypothetical protein